jgi:predicted dehydrogenase
MLRYDALDVRPDARLSLAVRGVEITDAGPNSAAQFEYRDETPRSLPHDETAPLGRELEAFFQAVATGNPISQNGPEAAVAVVRTLAGAATSLKCGGSWVELG